MKLATFRHGGTISAGVVVDDRVVAFDDLVPGGPSTIEALLSAGEGALAILRSRCERAAPSVALAEVELLAPIRFPRKFLAIGLNYASHIAEAEAMDVPTPVTRYQVWFNKQTSCIAGPFDPIHVPPSSEQLDFEGELAVVIGRRCRHVAASEAHKAVAGYMIVNDVSVRDWQKRTPTATLGKSFDTHGPTGPWLTTADEIADPHSLTIRTLVDGTLMQQGNTSEMIDRIDGMIAYLTTVMTLQPGDILATGTPAGVGGSRRPPVWLRPGQRVRVEIDGLGFIDNPIIDEPVAETTFLEG